MTRVLIVDCSRFPDIYRPSEGWRQWLGTVQADTVHLPSGHRPAELAPYSHVILTGSESSIVQPEPWFEVEANIVRSCFDRGIRMLGSCFGHQMLARTLAGRGCVARAIRPELGWTPIQWQGSDYLFEGLPNPSWMFTSHFDEVRELPAPWQVLAQSAGCAVAAMRYADRPIWGIQPHPEITATEARVLLDGLLARAPEQAALLQPARSQQPRDDGVIGEIVRRFLAA